MVVSRDQRAGQNHSVKIDSNSFEGVEEFKYLGTNLTPQRGVTSTARHSENVTCRGATSTARHAARSHSFVYISTT